MQRQFSAGGLVYRQQGSETVWLVRRPTPNPEFHGNLGWSFPKGWLDDREGGKIPGPLGSGERVAIEEEIQAGALREVREEGGIVAIIDSKLSTLKLFFTDAQTHAKVMKFVTYYKMAYQSDVPEGHDNETAEVRWVTKAEGQQLLTYKSEKELLANA